MTIFYGFLGTEVGRMNGTDIDLRIGERLKLVDGDELFFGNKHVGFVRDNVVFNLAGQPQASDDPSWNQP
ncbi:MAG: hypothetical protein WA906_05200 [Pacificimonas sp.]